MTSANCSAPGGMLQVNLAHTSIGSQLVWYCCESKSASEWQFAVGEKLAKAACLNAGTGCSASSKRNQNISQDEVQCDETRRMRLLVSWRGPSRFLPQICKLQIWVVECT